MSEKSVFGKYKIIKIIAIIFCIFAAVCAVALICRNIYLDGQVKFLDKYYAALLHNDFEGYKACFSENEDVAEEWFAKDKNKILILQDNEDVHAKIEFLRRERYDWGDYNVYHNLTVYNGNESIEMEKLCITVYREDGKWVIRT